MALVANPPGDGGPEEIREGPGEGITGDVQRLIVSCNRDGMTSMREGNLKAAFEQFKYAEAILLANQLEGDNTSLLATTCNNLGCYYKKVGKFHGALSYLRRALKMEVELQTDEVSLAGTHLNLCAVLSKLEKHDKAVQHALMALEKMNKKIAAADKGASQDDYTVLSIAYHNIGLERELMKEWDQAATAYRTGYEVARRFLSENHALTITLLNNSNAALRSARQTKERPGVNRARSSGSGFASTAGSSADGGEGPPSSPSMGGGGGGLTLPPINKKGRGVLKGAAEAQEYLKSEEALWANFASKTLHSDGPAMEVDVMHSDQEEHDSLAEAAPLSRAALNSMQDLGLIMPQAYDMARFRFPDKGMSSSTGFRKNLLEKALDDNPRALMDIIDAEGDGEPSLSTPNDFRPNRSMKRSTRTSRVVRRTGVFNSTVNRDKVTAELSKGGKQQPKAASAQVQKEAATKIQTIWRAWHKYLQDNSEWMTVTWICATMIQSHWRSYHVRRQKLDKIVTNVQRHVRGILVRRTLRWHHAAVTIQKRMIGVITRKQLKRLHAKATDMQRLVRGGLARRRYAKLFNYKVGLIVTIQRYVRVWLAKRKADEKKKQREEERLLNKATTDLQRMFRGWKGRARAFEKYCEHKQAEREYWAATKVQSHWRAKRDRRRVDGIREQLLQEMEKAATFLRKVWLGAQTKKQYQQLQLDFKRAEGHIVTIQRYMRGCICRMRLWRDAVKFEEQQWAAIEIQRHWRGYRGRVRWEDTLEKVWRREMAAALIQRNVRGFAARQKTNHKKRQIARAKFEKHRNQYFAAQKIQARARGIIARKVVIFRLVRARKAATSIQRIHRGGVVRHRMWTQVREQRAIILQAAARRFLVRRRFQKLHQKVTLIQRTYKDWLGLSRVRRLTLMKEKLLRKQKAIMIQKAYRDRRVHFSVKKLLEDSKRQAVEDSTSKV
eukprot:TRINITY_DN29355_c0_g1_i1.p1 TRINITY_DN29355_c0_g1~~TRINITY_DN29355_c0_g1_i1.p1  ORF type:complete len:951 (+),score=199.94 TRINITY_DN29355_c0_g1_i1:64-2916(+)